MIQADACLSGILDRKKEKVNLIIVGSITDRSKLVSSMLIMNLVIIVQLFLLLTAITANLLVNKLYEHGRLADKATLIAVRPLRIGTRSVLNRFQQYIPPDG